MNYYSIVTDEIAFNLEQRKLLKHIRGESKEYFLGHCLRMYDKIIPTYKN